MLCSRKMISFFFGKDVRKILKRKDSDAEERGRALENLRASLFSELRTSEGAKRQQQRVCGPTVALAFNFIVSVGIIMMNKLVLGRVGFNFPIFLTFIHYVLSWFLMFLLNVFSFLPPCPPSKSTPYSSLLALGTVMSLSNGLANVSLKYNSVGFYQMAKIAVTPTIVLAKFICSGKRVSYQKVSALTMVSIGVAVATVTDLQFNFFGACIALAWIVPSAANKILWSNLQQQDNWTALANTLAILMSATLGFLLQWSGALALGATSATTHVILGQFKTCVILLGGFLLFHSNPGMSSICGAVTSLAGMSVYTYLNLQDAHQQETKPIGRQISVSLKSRFSKENVDSHDANCDEESV